MIRETDEEEFGEFRIEESDRFLAVTPQLAVGKVSVAIKCVGDYL